MTDNTQLDTAREPVVAPQPPARDHPAGKPSRRRMPHRARAVAAVTFVTIVGAAAFARCRGF